MSSRTTVFLTGSTGFIAKHVCLQLLEAGYKVRASMRSLGREEELRNAMRANLANPSHAEGHLECVELDLTNDKGWQDAMSGCEALIHTASPFPMVQPKNEQDLIRPAVEGTMRALGAAAAAGIGHTVLTSSSVAIMEGHGHGTNRRFTEDDWTNLDGPHITAYAKSKTLAEKAAWEFVEAKAPDMALTVINPTLVLGPALDGRYGTSLQIIERILKSKDPMLPDLGFLVVDVRDIAAMHVRAIENRDARNARFIGTTGFVRMKDMAEIISKANPGRKITKRVAPNIFIRLLSLFDPSLGQIIPALGKTMNASNERARNTLGIEFRSVEDAVLEAANSVMKYARI